MTTETHAPKIKTSQVLVEGVVCRSALVRAMENVYHPDGKFENKVRVMYDASGSGNYDLEFRIGFFDSDSKTYKSSIFFGLQHNFGCMTRDERRGRSSLDHLTKNEAAYEVILDSELAPPEKILKTAKTLQQDYEYTNRVARWANKPLNIKKICLLDEIARFAQRNTWAAWLAQNNRELLRRQFITFESSVSD